MGLALEVGILADLKTADDESYAHLRDQFSLLNSLLAKHGLPLHNEPEDVPIFSCDMWSYSGLHYLRRIAAHLLVNGAMPGPCLGGPTSDPTYESCYDQIATYQDTRDRHEKRFDHLLCHSDAEGFYLPIQFGDVLYDFDDLGIEGYQVGSSQVLLRECLELANLIGLPTETHPEDDIFFNSADAQGDGAGWCRYGIESYACIRLIAAARHSIATGAAIIFT